MKISISYHIRMYVTVSGNEWLRFALAQMFQILSMNCQNVFNENLIRASKFSGKIPNRSENINNMHTEFPRSGTYTPPILPV